MNKPPADPESQRPGWKGAPLLRVLAAQAAGAVLAFGAALLAARLMGVIAPLFPVLVLQGVIAALLGRPLGLPRWWIPIQMVLPPAAALASMASVPAWVPLALFVLLALVFWNSARSRVPLYLTNRTTEIALAALVPPKPGARALDIGHGLGAAVMALARIRPDIQAEGIENAPIPFALSWARNLFAGPRNARLLYGDFWRKTLAGYDLVYAFLSPAPMSALYAKAKAEMDAGSLLVSNSFAVDGIEPDEVRVLDDGRKTRLYVYRM